jgi:predicted ester cyclase
MGAVVTESNKRLVRRFYEEVVNTGAVERVAEFVDPGCVETDGRIRVESGIDGMAEHVRSVRTVYPDLHLTIERQVAEGEWVVSVVCARGTHAGEWLGIEPTGKRLAYSAVNVDRVVEGLIVEHGGAANLLIPLMHVGAVRPAGPESSRRDGT